MGLTQKNLRKLDRIHCDEELSKAQRVRKFVEDQLPFVQKQAHYDDVNTSQYAQEQMYDSTPSFLSKILCAKRKHKVRVHQQPSFHLLEKFTSPNIQISRISMPRGQNNNRKAGMFNNGKSSSKAKKGAPDLVFSESRFLRPHEPSPPEDPVISTAVVQEPPATDGSSKFFADHDKTFEHAEPDCYYHKPQCYARGDTPADLLLLAQPMHNDVVTPYEEVMPYPPPRPSVVDHCDPYCSEEDELITEDDDASLGYTTTTNDDVSLLPDLRFFWQQRRAY